MNVEIPSVGIVEFPDGTPDDVIEKALEAYRETPAAPPPQPNPDGTYGQAPEGFFPDPRTGAMTSRELLRNNADPSRVDALIGGALQGMSFRHGDELAGGMGALQGGGDMANLRKEQARAKLEAAQEAFPYSYGGSEIGGGALASAYIARLVGGALPVAAPALGAQMFRGGMQGLIEGFGYGFGGGEGFTDRIKKGVASSALGGAVGVAAPAAIAGGRKLFDAAIAGPVASMRSAPSANRASLAVQKALDRSGKTADDVTTMLERAALEGQPEFATVDALGNSGQRMLSGVARQPGDMRSTIADTLMSRQDDQAGRIGGFLSDSLGATDTAAQRTAALKAARSDAAGLAYDAARGNAAPVDVRGALQVIDDRLGPMSGMGVAGDGIDAKLSSYRGRLAAPKSKLPGGATAVELSDFDRVLGVKQSISDDIGAALRAGRNNEARELGKVQSAIDQALEGASDMYRTANDDFAKASRVIDSVDAGKAATGIRARSGDVVPQYQGMTPDQQAAFRSGYADPLLAKIEGSAPGVNNARPLSTPKMQAELGAMARDPELLQRQIQRERTMFDTTSAALGGSKTADNLADIQDVATFDNGILSSLLTGNFKGAALQTALKGANTLQGRNTATRDLMAQYLLSRDLGAALAPARKIAGKVAKQNKVVEAITRASGRGIAGLLGL